MEGLADALLRAALTSVGGIDGCVTEFVRVTDTLLPRAVWLRRVPELAH
ncbi:MAG TPA: tRNA dihydrouridine(16) synthase DusC, partial [Plasticicumulans sp.]|nr:tRNA dihydrouridine(16) synthase DusC [Plasticicumulans sp.]